MIKERFPYSVDNPPSADELRTKIFAVHSTSILPRKGYLKAGARNIGFRGRWNDEPASFRPTIHFSLGEVVRQTGDFSWDENPYAVVAPLSTLEPQLVNLFTHDTFILGDYKLTPEAKLLVPQGTDTSKLPQSVVPLTYNPRLGLRRAVDQYIRSQRGWPVRMRDQSVSIGSVAYINGSEINTAAFFARLFDEIPHLAHGSHANSERGEAYRFGVTEQSISWAMKTYSDHWARYSTAHVRFYRELILHNLERLSELVPTWGLAPISLKTFDTKRKRLLDWVNILDVDLEIRQQYGKSFAGASEEVQQPLRKARGKPAELRAIAQDFVPLLPWKEETDALQPPVLAEILHTFPLDEVEQFIAKNRELFRTHLMPEFWAKYATQRMVLVTEEKAKEEGLPMLLSESLPRVRRSAADRDYYSFSDIPVVGDLKDYLSEESNRLGRALGTLRIPAAREYLTKNYGFTFTDDEPHSLEELVKAYPETRVILSSQRLRLNRSEQEAYLLLKEMGEARTTRRRTKKMLKSMRDASSRAFDIRWSRRRLGEDIQTALKPINASVWHEEMTVGSTLDLYQIMQRDRKLEEVWGKLGLAKEFRHIFPEDKDFWETPFSLVEVRELLDLIKQHSIITQAEPTKTEGL